VTIEAEAEVDGTIGLPADGNGEEEVKNKCSISSKKNNTVWLENFQFANHIVC